jgi:hypothetical protein
MNRKNTLALAAFFLIFTAFSGCGGGFNCPFDRPSCCDNILFGCGPFDLPQGCSCSDFFSYSSRGSFAVKRGELMRMTATTAAGRWRVRLNRQSSNCRNVLSTVVSNMTLSQSGSRVTLTAPGIATMRGTRTNNTINTTGQYTPLLFIGCDAQLSSRMQLTANDKASVTGSVKIICKNRPANNCSASYSGEAAKLARPQ